MPRSDSETNRAVGGSDPESAPVTLYVGSLEGLNSNGDPDGLSRLWKRWEEAFNLYVSGKGVAPSVWHSAGMDVQKLRFTLVGEGSSSLTVNALHTYFIPKPNVLFEGHFSFRYHKKVEKPWISLSVSFSAQLAMISEIEKTNMRAMKSLTSASQVTALQVPRKGANIDAGRFFKDCQITGNCRLPYDKG